MDKLSSTEFRKSFARLTKPTAVTVNGHAIGSWIPLGATLTMDTTGILTRGVRGGDEDPDQYVTHDRFNSQPFTGPIPKVRKP